MLCSSICDPFHTFPDQKRLIPSCGQHNRRDVPLTIDPKYTLQDEIQPPFLHRPGAIRNPWFRISTYQHMKPNIENEKHIGNKLMRWG